MNDIKLSAFQALHPVVETKVQSNEAEEYLNCKFWQPTKKEAKLFLYFYIAPVHYETLHRAIGIISGDLFNFDDPDDFFAQPSFDEKYKHIIVAIQNSNDYPSSFLIDDIVEWAENNQLMSAEIAVLAKQKIIETRSSVFKKNDVKNYTKKRVLKLILQRDMNFISYLDAKEIFNLDDSIYPDLKIAVEKYQIINSYYSRNKQIYYFDPRSLTKWLMRHGYFPGGWIEDFIDIKKESVKETISPTPKLFTLKQLQTWLERNYQDEHDIFYHINNRVYNAYINSKDDVSFLYSEHKVIPRGDTTYKIRYAHLERLLLPDADHYGIAKKLLDDVVIKATDYRNHVGFDVTDDEYNLGLHRIFYLRKINESGTYNQLCQEDLRFIVDEVQDGLKKLHSSIPKKYNRSAKRNGKIAGNMKRDEAAKKWSQIRRPILKLAQEHKPIKANKLANIAARRELITLAQVSNVAKKIRDDVEFKPYLHMKK